nr:MAG TPA: hypothetical protein [Caudoviricetes sp.]
MYVHEVIKIKTHTKVASFIGELFLCNYSQIIKLVPINCL